MNNILDTLEVWQIAFAVVVVFTLQVTGFFIGKAWLERLGERDDEWEKHPLNKKGK